MSGYIDGLDREQSTLFPERLEDWISEDNPVRAMDVFVDALDLAELGFERSAPGKMGRPCYHPAVLLKLYIYGYLNRVQSSRRLEREAGRNVEVMWLTGRLAPDHKTIADFRKDNGAAIRKVFQISPLSQESGRSFSSSTPHIIRTLSGREKIMTRNRVIFHTKRMFNFGRRQLWSLSRMAPSGQTFPSDRAFRGDSNQAH